MTGLGSSFNASLLNSFMAYVYVLHLRILELFGTMDFNFVLYCLKEAAVKSSPVLCADCQAM